MTDLKGQLVVVLESHRRIFSGQVSLTGGGNGRAGGCTWISKF